MGEKIARDHVRRVPFKMRLESCYRTRPLALSLNPLKIESLTASMTVEQKYALPVSEAIAN